VPDHGIYDPKAPLGRRFRPVQNLDALVNGANAVRDAHACGMESEHGSYLLSMKHCGKMYRNHKIRLRGHRRVFAEGKKIARYFNSCRAAFFAVIVSQIPMTYKLADGFFK
jgi:hypothetical protein